MQKVLFSTISACIVAISVFYLPIANIYAYSYIVPLCPETGNWSTFLEPLGGCDFYIYALQALFGILLFVSLRLLNSKYLSFYESLITFSIPSTLLTSLSVYIGRYYFMEAFWFLSPVLILLLNQLYRSWRIYVERTRIQNAGEGFR